MHDFINSKLVFAAMKHRFWSRCKTCDISNKPVDISCENSCDIRFKSQSLRVNPDNRIHPLLSAVESLNPFQRLCVADISEINLSG